MKSLVTILLIFTIVHFATSQIIVSGKITSFDDGTELIGVTIMEKWTENMTFSDITGDYKMTLKDTNAILVYSFVGLKTVESRVGKRPIHDIQMETDYSALTVCYFPLRFTEIGFSTGLKYTPIGFELHNLTPNIGGINFHLESSLIYRTNANNEYIDIAVRRYGLFNINNLAIGITGEYSKFSISDNYFKEFIVTPNINFRGYRLSIGYTQQIQQINDGQGKPVNGIYLGLSKYLPYNIGIFIRSQYLKGIWQYDVDIVRHFYKSNLSLGIGYEKISDYNEGDISLAYRINY